jgi:sortase B
MSGNEKRNLIPLLLAVISAFISGFVLFAVYNSQSAEKNVVVKAAPVDSSASDPEASRLDEEIKATGEVDEAGNSFDKNEVSTDVVEEAGSESDIYTAADPKVDLSMLRETNPDIVAWVEIPGTGIDHPVAQHPTNDEYYLKHGAEGMYSKSGCPYIELSDSGSFMEFNTVIYGHNMNDGSMFAPLHSFENEGFFSEHRELNISTADHYLTYRIFAAVMFDDRRIPYYFNDTLESDRTAFLQALRNDIVAERSVLADDIEVSEDDCIVTLSTCDKKLRNKRFLVVGVLTGIDGQDVR